MTKMGTYGCYGQIRFRDAWRSGDCLGIWGFLNVDYELVDGYRLQQIAAGLVAIDKLADVGLLDEPDTWKAKITEQSFRRDYFGQCYEGFWIGLPDGCLFFVRPACLLSR